LCEGDCDNDGDCEGSLVCFQRHGGVPATVPGCAGSPYADNEDYCVQASSMLQKEDGAKVKAEKKEKKRTAKPIQESLLEAYKLRAKRGCEHTDNGAADPYGDDCNDYDSYPNWCGGYDSNTFTSSEMCCACGGGVEASQCACENPGHGTFASCTSSRNCNCNGQVRMGYGNRWTSWRDVSGSIQCTNGAFGGDPAPGQAKECQCAGGFELLRSGSCPANKQVSRAECLAAAQAVGADSGKTSLDGGNNGGLNGRPSGCTLHEWGNVEWWGQSDNANCGSLNYNCVCRQ